MASSSYAQAINEQRYSLIEQLVTKLLHVQRDGENFSIAYDFCVQKAWFNTFPDVNPRETEELYASLVARLEADSQLTKASALSALTNKLLALKLHSTAGVPDLNHNLLQLLASLSDQPLSSSFELTPDVLDLLYNPADRLATDAQQLQSQQRQEQQIEQQQPARSSHFQRLLKGGAGKGASSCDADRAAGSDDEVDPYGEQDEPLSDWGDSDTEQQQQPWRQEDSSDTEHDAKQDLQELQEQQQQQQQQPPWPKGPALMARQVVPAALPHGCIVAAPQQPLPKLRLLRPPPAAAAQQTCLSEHFLAQQVLRVLQGLPAQGFFMQDPRHPPQLSPQQQQQQQQPGEDSAKGGVVSSAFSSMPYFEVDGRVSTPQMATSSLHALLADAAAAGTCHRRMRALVQQLAYGSSLMHSKVEVTPCLRAFAVALQQQLDGLGMQLADLQQQLQQEFNQRTSSSSGMGSLTGGSRLQQQGERGLLMRCFRHEARPIVQRLHLLHDTAFGILLQLSGPPAAVSAGLIDGLAAAAHAASSCDASGPQGVSGAAALLHLLLSSCVPLSRALAQWLWCAEDNVAEPQQDTCDTAAVAAQGDHNQQQQRVGASVCASDFFILRKASKELPAVHPSFWHTAYGCSQQSTPAGASSGNAGAGPSKAAAAVCCPAVLAPFVHSIITAGKSMRLLDYMDQEDLKRSSLCSSTGAVALGAAPGQGQTAAAQQQQQRPASARPGGSGSAQQRRPSTPLRRRPSSAGPRISNRAPPAAAAAEGGILAGRLSRQPSWTGRPASAAAGQHSTASSKGGSSSRKKWEVAEAQPVAPAPPACHGAAAAVYAVDRSAVARRVELQLAAAAAVAGQQLVDNELPHEFIGSVNFLLQQEQELQAKAHGTMQQHKQYLQDCSSSTLSSSASQLLLQRLEAVAAALARPNDPPAGAGGDARLPNLRCAVAAARKARASDAALLGGAKQEQQHQGVAQLSAQQQATTGATAAEGAEVAVTVAADSLEGCSSSFANSFTSPAKAGAGPNSNNSSSGSGQQGQDELSPRQQPDVPAELQTPPKAAGPTADTGSPADIEAAPQAASTGADAAPAVGSTVASSGCNSSSSGDGSSPNVVPKLTVWKDQMEAKLIAAHHHLQRMAPWQQHPSCSSADDTQEPSDSKQQQQQRGQPGSKGAVSRQAGSSTSSSKNWLLRTADTKVPGHFTGSLAELWPLKPVLGLKDLAASGASWLRDAGWPGCDLDWLLHHPPAHLPSVQQLLWSALVQPVRTRVELVDCQLMSSLMGEWGMLQQLQGLVNTFLITSPGMVEWVDALFAAVETTAATSQSTRNGGSAECSTPTSVSKTVSRIGAVAAFGCDSPGAYAASPGGGVVPGSAAGQRRVTVDDLELASVEAMLQDCILSADPDEVLPDVNSLLLTVNREGLSELREQQEKRRAAQAAGPPAAAGARQQPAVGLLLCSREWVGLELQHTGSWQLSLVYTDEHLKFFGQVWRVMLQLRWVRRRVAAQAVAHRISASVNDLSARDRLESAQAAAALAAGSSRTRPRSAGGFGAAFGAGYGVQQSELGGVGGMLEWLSGKEELLLLQEMNHFLGCWHSYVMDGLRVKEWGCLEQVLLSAKSLDQVHSATHAFFVNMCNLCYLTPPELAGRKHNMREATRQRLESLMDHALAAASAAAWLHAARQKLKELQGVAGREGDMLPWWRQLAEARTRLQQAGGMWQKGLGELLAQWALLKKHNVGHAFDELADLLDMNGYFRRNREATAGLVGRQAAAVYG